MVVAPGSLYAQISTALRLITPANVTDPVEFWLAFLLVLSIMNTVLKRVDIFSDTEGRNNKATRGLVSLIISFFAVTAIWVTPVLAYMSSTLAVTAVILVAILIVSTLAGFKPTDRSSKGIFAVALVILFLGGGLFSYMSVPSSSGTGSEISTIFSTLVTQDLAYLILGVVIIGVLAYAFSGSGGSGSSK